MDQVKAFLRTWMPVFKAIAAATVWTKYDDLAVQILEEWLKGNEELGAVAQRLTVKV